jgi:hypothetical protein
MPFFWLVSFWIRWRREIRASGRAMCSTYYIHPRIRYPASRHVRVFGWTATSSTPRSDCRRATLQMCATPSQLYTESKLRHRDVFEHSRFELRRGRLPCARRLDGWSVVWACGGNGRKYRQNAIKSYFAVVLRCDNAMFCVCVTA